MTNVLSRGSRLVALMGAVLVALGVHGTLLAGFEHLADNGSQHAELLAIVSLAAKTNHLANGLQVPLDAVFDKSRPV